MDPTSIVLRAAGTALVLASDGSRLPGVLHWGADPGPLGESDLRQLRLSALPPNPLGAHDEPVWLSLLPGESDDWQGHPALSGHRDGQVVHPRWKTRAISARALDGGALGDSGGTITIEAADDLAGLTALVELRMERSGLVRIRHSVGNTAPGTWTLEGLHATLPLPPEATELLDMTGRWCAERTPQRQPLTFGSRVRASRRGKTGHDAALLMVAGTPGFGFRSGEVWGMHVAWSGDHLHLAERLPEQAGQATAVLMGGELARPGEIRLGQGESYTTPWVCFAWSGTGLDGLSARVHRWLRSRPEHPTTPRPVVLNTWEAVYFDHDLRRLRELADAGARIGAERFVLDDGWFRHRRNDRAGLGDWTVDPKVWPEGLHPLFDHVRALGMSVGLWVEPEMVNPDSDLARAHPEWVLAHPDRWPTQRRHQHVLDLGRPEVTEYLLERLSALVGEYRLDYLKWDHNRDLVEAVHAPTGQAGAHRQTRALYDLLAALRRRHPGLEIETCAGGGGRVDLGILAHTDRVWASDANDALERQAIQRWTGLLLPPELVGSHVGGPVAHTTGRAARLEFRALTSLFAHAGIEWDITTCTPEESRRMAEWIRLYKGLRSLLHGGDVVRADHPDPGAWLHGVVSPGRDAAVFSYVRLATSVEAYPGRARIPGLDPERRYRVWAREELAEAESAGGQGPEWLRGGGCVLPGSVLGNVGLQMPVLLPGNAILLQLAGEAEGA